MKTQKENLGNVVLSLAVMAIVAVIAISCCWCGFVHTESIKEHNYLNDVNITTYKTTKGLNTYMDSARLYNSNKDTVQAMIILWPSGYRASIVIPPKETRTLYFDFKRTDRYTVEIKGRYFVTQTYIGY